MSLNSCIEFEKLFDPDEIVGTIKEWQKNLEWSECDCKNDVKMVYINEDLNIVYCEYHANPADHHTIPLELDNQLKYIESLLNALEKKWLYAQKQMANIRSENFSLYPNSSSSK